MHTTHPTRRLPLAAARRPHPDPASAYRRSRDDLERRHDPVGRRRRLLHRAIALLQRATSARAPADLQSNTLAPLSAPLGLPRSCQNSPSPPSHRDATPRRASSISTHSAHDVHERQRDAVWRRPTCLARPPSSMHVSVSVVVAGRGLAPFCQPHRARFSPRTGCRRFTPVNHTHTCRGNIPERRRKAKSRRNRPAVSRARSRIFNGPLVTLPHATTNNCARPGMIFYVHVTHNSRTDTWV